MQYKLINPNLNAGRRALLLSDIVLRNRGVSDPYTYTHLTEKNVNGYSSLTNIDRAAECLLEAVGSNKKVSIVVDTDCDGYVSAAILYSYLSKISNPENIVYYLHRGKSHGIPKNLAVFEGVDLILCPDSATNDIELAGELAKQGKTVIVLDHHESEKPNPYAIVVNNQICDYPNKELSGSGIVWQFLRVLDDILWNNYADEYLDLVALANIADSMDLRSYETKYLVDQGLKRIKNKFFIALLEKQAYSTGGKADITNIKFYINPLINALVRSGSQAEKELMFKAFCEQDEWFDYKKRGEDEVTQEDIYSRVARLAVNARSRQNREIEKAMSAIEVNIEKYKWSDNKLLFVLSGDMDGSMTGLVCMKLASKYNKPCILLRENNWKEGYFGGSLRNFEGSPIEDLKEFLLSTNQFDFVQGHGNAAGVSIEKSKIRDTIKLTNEILKNTNFEKIWKIDFLVKKEEITRTFLEQLNSPIIRDAGDVLIGVENFSVSTADVRLMGSKRDTWKIPLDEAVIIKFRCGEDDPLLGLMDVDDWEGVDVKLNLVCKFAENEYNGITEKQLIVLDYEIMG